MPILGGQELPSQALGCEAQASARGATQTLQSTRRPGGDNAKKLAACPTASLWLSRTLTSRYALSNPKLLEASTQFQYTWVDVGPQYKHQPPFGTPAASCNQPSPSACGQPPPPTRQ